MIHTPNIVETGCRGWRQLLGQALREVEGFTISELDALCEISFSLDPNETSRYISWMQEDGEHDDTFFYWLSLRETSHFILNTLAPFSIDSTCLVTLSDSPIVEIDLYGDPTQDAIYGVLLHTERSTAAIAATGWNEHKKEFSPFGVEEIAILSPTEFQTCITQQDLALLGELK